MKKIFIHITSLDGCAYHRLILPYQKLMELTDEFQISFGYSRPSQELTFEQKVKEIAANDILIFHRLLPPGLLDAVREANPNIKVIIDMDDAWRLNDSHPSAEIYRKEGTSETIRHHLTGADYVTGTTEYRANKIRPFNPNVTIFPNALNREGQFVPEDIPSGRLRFGLIGSSSHAKDVELLDGVVKQLPKDVLDKIQFVLCGFDQGHYRVYQPDGSIKLIPMPYEQNLWHKIEVMLSDNYNTITPEHKDFLLEHRYKVDYTTDEAYHRVWSRDVDSYAELYNQIDVLMIPLLGNDFTACKSDLKMIEASAMGKAVIVSDVDPYKECAINAIEKGGTINENGNCIMVNNSKGSKGWVKAITRLTNDESLRQMIASNLSKLVDEPKYNLTAVSRSRIEFLRNI